MDLIIPLIGRRSPSLMERVFRLVFAQDPLITFALFICIWILVNSRPEFQGVMRVFMRWANRLWWRSGELLEEVDRVSIREDDQAALLEPVLQRLAANGITGPVHMSVDWAERAKTRFGILSDRPANRSIIRDWLYREMRNADVRHTDMRRAIPLCVELALLANNGELAAREFGRAASVQIRKREYLGGYWRFDLNRYYVPCWRWVPEDTEK